MTGGCTRRYDTRPNGTMTPLETQLFEVLDNYARTHHGCFLAEMFPDKKGIEYVLCFRPVDVSAESTDRHSCRYLRIALTDAQAIGQTKTLAASIKEKLGHELHSLRRAGGRSL